MIIEMGISSYFSTEVISESSKNSFILFGAMSVILVMACYYDIVISKLSKSLIIVGALNFIIWFFMMFYVFNFTNRLFLEKIIISCVFVIIFSGISKLIGRNIFISKLMNLLLYIAIISLMIGYHGIKTQWIVNDNRIVGVRSLSSKDFTEYYVNDNGDFYKVNGMIDDKSCIKVQQIDGKLIVQLYKDGQETSDHVESVRFVIPANGYHLYSYESEFDTYFISPSKIINKIMDR